MDLVNFMNKYGDKKYIHIFSKTKYCLEYCRELEHQLLLEYPEYHQRILHVLKNG